MMAAPICRSMSQALINAARSMLSTKRSLVSSWNVLKVLKLPTLKSSGLSATLKPWY